MRIQSLSLYQYQGCPFCRIVLQAAAEMGRDLELRDIQQEPDHYRELIEATGRQTVPCLRIEQASGETEWMHESRDIILYLQELPSE